MAPNFDTLRTFTTGSGEEGFFHSLPALAESGASPNLSRLPVSIRIVLESVLRHCDGVKVTENDVRNLANWNAASPGDYEIPFTVARIVLQDFTGVPLLVDLAAMRDAAVARGASPDKVEPLVPVDLVVDHSVQVDFSGSQAALDRNMAIEFIRNRERYEFLKWGQQAFETFSVVPPGIGIVHQVNLEYLAKGVLSRESQISNLKSQGVLSGESQISNLKSQGVLSRESQISNLKSQGVLSRESQISNLKSQGVLSRESQISNLKSQGVLSRESQISNLKSQGVLSGESEISNLKSQIYYPDTLVGTDSHTTMINGLGVVGWGVGGIEAEAGMLGQPVTFLVPEVVGVHLHGELPEGVTATDLTLRVTEILRAHGVVGKFVEFHGPGAAALSLPDRATIANMAPEYGATMGFFPVDDETIAYLRGTGRSEELCATVENYYKAQGLFGIPGKGECDYTDLLELDLSTIVPGVAGPKRPQDRIDVPVLGEKFDALFTTAAGDGGFGESAGGRDTTVPLHLDSPAGEFDNPLIEGESITATDIDTQLRHGSVLIAAITSCTNTSNPSVMLAAGLVAKKANAKGLQIAPFVKSSLGPGSRVVTDYLEATGLQEELDALGFQTVGYGCTTCIGNSGPLHPAIEAAIKEGDLVCASVLSGNRNFEARVHGSVRANFLMSPPLVVAYALAGRVDLDLTTEPLGAGQDGNPVFLKDLWPTGEEIREQLAAALKPEVYATLYGNLDTANPKWGEVAGSTGAAYAWDENSTYVQSPPFFAGTGGDIENLHGARPLGIFGDSVTTDHISPAGAIKPASPAGQYLIANGVEPSQFNSFGARRGNDRVMTRGTFGNVRIKNTMCPGVEGGYTQYFGGSDVPAPDTEIAPLDGAKPTFIYDASMAYQEEGAPLIVIGGEDYGMGSSRDWAAKGTRLLGVRAVVTKSFERIHRSNLVGMGVLPLNFKDPADYGRLSLTGSETFDLTGLGGEIKPRMEAALTVRRTDGSTQAVPVIVRLDTPVEIDYYRAGGILPYVLNQIL